MRLGVTRWSLLALASASLAGCLGGGGGDSGTTSSTASPSAASQPPTLAANNSVIKVGTLTADQFSSLDLSGTGTKVTGATVSSPPKVYFNVTDANGNPIAGLKTTNFGFMVAKLVPGSNGSPSKWVTYNVLSQTNVPGKPNTENYGTLVDNGDGSYVYTFFRDITKAKDELAAAALPSSCSTDPASTSYCNKADLGDLTYDANLTHRIAIQIGGGQVGATSAQYLKTPVNLIYDFVPATGTAIAQTETDESKQRNMVDIRACQSCHVKFAVHGGDQLTGRGGNRQDVRLCVLCHTDQRKYSVPEATVGTTTITPRQSNGSTDRIGNMAMTFFPSWVHRLHMGEYLTKTGYAHEHAGSVFVPNHIKFPQDPRNCKTCHTDKDGATGGNIAPQADNWKNKPSRQACGGCHDGIDFATGAGTTTAGATTGHIGGAQSNDQACALCHTPAVITTQHTPVNLSHDYAGHESTGAAISFASDPDNLPPGAHKLEYDLNSVTLDSSRRPVFKFKIKKDGTDAAFNTPGATTELLSNFVGSVGLYVAYGIAEDGVTSPADWNMSQSTHLKAVFQGQANTATNGTWAGPDANGYYTVTFPTSKAIPAGAGAVTAWMGLWHDHTNHTGGLVQMNVAGYPEGINVPVTAVKKAVTGETARRQIVDNAKCNNCHKTLGIFYKTNFHDGQRNHGESCLVCHNGSRTGNGFPKSASHFVHGIHGAGKRTVDYTAWSGAGFEEIGYPGILRQCSQCHVSDAVNYGTTAAKSAAENGQLLWMSAAGGSGATSTQTVADNADKSPWVAAGTYGSAHASATPANKATSIVNSPIASACNGCHTDSQAIGHMRSNGGVLYQARNAVNTNFATTGTLTNNEGCLTCHGKGKIADAETAHLSTVQ